MVSARDAGITLELLRGRGIPFTAIGGLPPAGRARKVAAVGWRAARLRRFIARHRPAALICSSRPAAVAARAAGVPGFVICDYEHAELGIFARAGAHIVHPAVVPAGHFLARGFPAERLVAFDGIKEDLSFANVDLEATEPYELGPGADGALRILVRPAAEISHYFTPRSRELLLALLAHLASCEDVLTVFSPRYPSQVADLGELTWRRPPVVLREAVPFLSLLRAVDRVVSAGGTMIREAAYLGLPAYSLFSGEPGAVDAHLERTGRLHLLRSEGELGLVTAPARPLAPFPRRPAVLEEVLDAVLAGR